ncbi:MAG: glycosyltransferase [Patescibacteria group bacterium]|nr:glycosyltransferase [Patescibacteria group bacterium]
MSTGKILILDSYYGAVLKDFYRKHPEVLSLPFKELREKLMELKFGTSDFYSKNLNKLGWDAQEFVVNDPVSQGAWLKEYGLKENLFPRLVSVLSRVPKAGVVFQRLDNILNWGSLYQIVKKQIDMLRPDVVYIQNISAFSPLFLQTIKPKIKLLAGQIAYAKPPAKYFRPYDLILTSLPNYVKDFRDQGLSAEYLKLGFEGGLVKELQKNPSLSHNAVHIGGYGKIHNERNEVLEAVAKDKGIDIKFWGYGTSNLPESSLIKKNYQGQAWGLDRLRIFYNSKITLTKHITAVAGGYANNMTLYEATGSGIFLITDWKQNLPELFTPGEEVETYRSVPELIDKLKYYLSHDKEREKIAQAGQARTLREHTYEKRMEELTQIINKYL